MRIPAQELKATFQEILLGRGVDPVIAEAAAQNQIGRASCRERV